MKLRTIGKGQSVYIVRIFHTTGKMDHVVMATLALARKSAENYMQSDSVMTVTILRPIEYMRKD